MVWRKEAPFGNARAERLFLGTANGRKGTEVTSTAAELNILDGVTATGAEINEACDKSTGAAVSLTDDVSLTQALHANKICVLNKAAGITATLPEATGTGDEYTLIVGTAATSNSYIVVTPDLTNSDITGLATGVDQDDDSTDDFPAIQADGMNTITLNRTTTGGVQPGYDKIVITDVATDLWNARVIYSVPAGSNPATPFSAAT